MRMMIPAWGVESLACLQGAGGGMLIEFRPFSGVRPHGRKRMYAWCGMMNILVVDNTQSNVALRNRFRDERNAG